MVGGRIFKIDTHNFAIISEIKLKCSFKGNFLQTTDFELRCLFLSA